MPHPLSGRKGSYGFDAPYVPLGLGAAGLVLLAFAVHAGARGWLPVAGVAAAGAACFLASAGSYLYTTRRGKFTAWSRVLSALELKGNERVLDLGCGRGAVLLMAAEMVPGGRVAGVDLWSRADQSGNHETVTRRNAVAEGVEQRVDLHTADMRSLPFPDEQFDLVLSSLAIHNIPTASERGRAIDEAVRTLKRGGRIAVADFRHASEYADRLRSKGLSDVAERSLGWRCWYGGPWAATRLVTARKPG